MGKLFDDQKNGGEISYRKIENCIRIAELEFSKIDMESFCEELIQNEWSLEYIYLDRKTNLYEYKLE